MPALFGFVQFDFAGTLGLSDGRYLARDPSDEGDDERQSVLVLLTTGGPSPAHRRRRKPRDAEADAPEQTLPLTRATAVRAFEPFPSELEAAGWLEGLAADEEATDRVIDEAAALLNRALHVAGVASGDPFSLERSPYSATALRVGYGTGDEVAESRFSAAQTIDIRGGAGARRRKEELRPQERIAAVLGDRERLDACETLLARARRDVDAKRWREAALQLRVGLEALLIELRGAMADPGHEEDIAVLAERRQEAGAAANSALRGELDPERREAVRELVAVCERVLRRRRVLRG